MSFQLSFNLVEYYTNTIQSSIINIENDIRKKTDISSKDVSVLDKIGELRSTLGHPFKNLIKPTLFSLKAQIKEFTNISLSLLEPKISLIRDIHFDYEALFLIHHLSDPTARYLTDMDIQNEMFEYLNKIRPDKLSSTDFGGQLLALASKPHLERKGNDEFNVKFLYKCLEKGARANIKTECGCHPIHNIVSLRPISIDLIAKAYASYPAALLFQNDLLEFYYAVNTALPEEKADIWKGLIEGGLPLNFKWNGAPLWEQILSESMKHPPFLKLYSLIVESNRDISTEMMRGVGLISQALEGENGNIQKRILQLKNAAVKLKLLEPTFSKENYQHFVELVNCKQSELENVQQKCEVWSTPYKTFLNEKPRTLKRKKEKMIAFSTSEMIRAFELINDTRSYEMAFKIFPYWLHIDGDKWYNWVVFNFILDKIYLKDYDSCSLMHHNYVIAQSLESLLSSTLKNCAYKGLMEKLSQAFQFSLFILKSSNLSDGRSYYPNMIMEKLKHLDQVPLIVPIGSKNHAMCMAIEKAENGTFSLSIYNTGEEISKYHPSLKNDAKISQTFITIENIAPNKLLNKQLWIDIRKTHRKGTTIQMYERILEAVAEGTKVAPSDDIEDYEQIQWQGTCTAQCLLACLRHLVRKHIPGSSLHNLGVYKYLKAHIQLEIIKEYLPHITDNIGLVRKREKQIQDDLTLFEVASDAQQYINNCKLLFQINQRLMPNSSSSFEVPSGTHFEKYAFLRKLLKTVAINAYNDQPAYKRTLDFINQSHPILELVHHRIHKMVLKDEHIEMKKQKDS